MGTEVTDECAQRSASTLNIRFICLIVRLNPSSLRQHLVTSELEMRAGGHVYLILFVVCVLEKRLNVFD